MTPKKKPGRKKGSGIYPESLWTRVPKGTGASIVMRGKSVSEFARNAIIEKLARETALEKKVEEVVLKNSTGKTPAPQESRGVTAEQLRNLGV